MSGFEDVIETLRRVQRNGDEQQRKLRKSAQVLEQLAALYTAAETENLDGKTVPVQRIAVRGRVSSPAPQADGSIGANVLQPVRMLPFARTLFGVETVWMMDETKGGGQWRQFP